MEIRTDNTETLKNALKRIEELEKDYKVLQTSYNILKDNDEKIIKEMGEQIEKKEVLRNMCKI